MLPITLTTATFGSSLATNSSTWNGSAARGGILIQPSFMFMVGVAMAYSCASRRAQGQSYPRMLLHAVVRSLVLILLGIFLRSDGKTQTYFTFEDVLTQIGLGYTFLFLLWGRPMWFQFAAALAILAGYWVYFYHFPLPPAEFDYLKVGVSSNWEHLTGIAAHWDKNTNAAAQFDQWFLNLFPRTKPFVYNGGGYLTLSFVPSLATMIFGLLSGELLRSPRTDRQKFLALVVAGVAGLAIGELLQWTGVCPIVKRIWTPSSALFSTGWTCLFLAAFFGIVDVLKFRRWTFPLVVVGMNSITMYCMEELSHDWFHRTLRTHLDYPFKTYLGKGIYQLLDKPDEPLVARPGFCWPCGSSATGYTGKRSSFAFDLLEPLQAGCCLESYVHFTRTTIAPRREFSGQPG